MPSGVRWWPSRVPQGGFGYLSTYLRNFQLLMGNEFGVFFCPVMCTIMGYALAYLILIRAIEWD